MAESIKFLIEQVNALLLKGEPGNISDDPHGGYTGYEPQAVFDAMNAVFEIGAWGFEELSSEIEPGEKGALAIAKVRVWLRGSDFQPTAWGQNRVTRGDSGDARKGAQTDALKKALSYFSIGNRAYHGLLVKKPARGQSAHEPNRTQAPVRSVSPSPQANAAPVIAIPTPSKLRARCEAVCGRGSWDAMLMRVFKAEVVPADDDLMPGDCAKIAAYLDRAEAMKKAS